MIKSLVGGLREDLPGFGDFDAFCSTIGVMRSFGGLRRPLLALLGDRRRHIWKIQMSLLLPRRGGQFIQTIESEIPRKRVEWFH